MIKERYSDTEIILISMFAPSSLTAGIKTCKADGYIPKSTDAQEVKRSINVILKGENLFLESDPESAIEIPFDKLITPLEQEIIALIKQGKTAKEISVMLYISLTWIIPQSQGHSASSERI